MERHRERHRERPRERSRERSRERHREWHRERQRPAGGDPRAHPAPPCTPVRIFVPPKPCVFPQAVVNVGSFRCFMRPKHRGTVTPRWERDSNQPKDASPRPRIWV